MKDIQYVYLDFMYDFQFYDKFSWNMLDCSEQFQGISVKNWWIVKLNAYLTDFEREMCAFTLTNTKKSARRIFRVRVYSYKLSLYSCKPSV